MMICAPPPPPSSLKKSSGTAAVYSMCFQISFVGSANVFWASEWVLNIFRANKETGRGRGGGGQNRVNQGTLAKSVLQSPVLTTPA